MAADQNDENVPSAFISYSHDSDAHKEWVLMLASRLRDNGVDVTLDRWDLGPGDDVPKFMEHAVRSSNRVLMICTEAYVRKANDGQGGVGYEAMVVTGELVQGLGTSKFIPVVRQQSEARERPASVATRFYVDLSEGEDFDSNFDTLLRELHQAPATPKPPLGRNPFACTPSGAESPAETPRASTAPAAGVDPHNPSSAYRAALELARQGDMMGWRRLIGTARAAVAPALLAWRDRYAMAPFDPAGALVEESMECVAAFAPLMAIALAGVGSGRARFANQLGLLEDILHPPEWSGGGMLTVRAETPTAAGFIYQGLHGAMCLQTGQLGLATKFIGSSIEPCSGTGSLPVWKYHTLMGWPTALGTAAGTAAGAWEVLETLARRWPWVGELFGGEADYRTALCAYYMALNVVEYVDWLKAGDPASPERQAVHLEIPLCFHAMDDDTKRRAYRLLTEDFEPVTEIWTSRGVSDNLVREHVAMWDTLCRSWYAQMYAFGVYGSSSVATKLAADLAPRGGERA